MVYKMLSNKLPLVGLAVLIAGCGLNDKPQQGEQQLAVPLGNEPVLIREYQAKVESPAQEQPAQAKAENAADQPATYLGSGKFIKAPKVREPIKLYGEAVSINFEQAPLIEVVHAVLGDILELDYIVEHPIQGEVTVRTRTPVKRDQLLTILESLLKSNGALLVRDADNRLFVSSSPNISKIAPALSNARSQGAGFSTTVIPLQFIGAAEMAEILKPVADDSAFLRVDPKRNLLILAGTRAQMQGWMDIINTFDVDVLQGMSVGIYPLKYATVADVESALTELVGAAGENALAGQAFRVLPLERLNSVLVITPQPRYLSQIEMWVKRLDRAPSSGSEKRLHVYPVQNATAEHLADLLSKVYSGSGSSSGSKRSVAPGLSQEKVTSGGSSTKSTDSNSSSSGDSSATSVSFGDVNVVADEENNALLIYSSTSEYERIEASLKQLDVVPTQVLIEASILEVTLTDNFKFGVEWSFKDNLSGGKTGTGLLGNTKNAIAAQLPGFSYTVADSAGNIRAVLNALSEQSLLNVISTPSIMALDNHQASIQVGDQQPVRTGSSTNADGDVLTSSVEFKDTGVKLSVTPSVNAGGLVSMDIEQSVTDIGTIDEATGQRAFNTREIKSRVAVRSGESIVLGGLIRENQTDSKIGLPGLHTVPVLGHLFGNTTENGTRTELLVIITPRVLSNEQDLRDLSQELRSRMRGFELIESEL
ncbi:type II secretion system protein GspD [Neptunomonas marina]|uniref:Type II secretion system protein GspD n=2 Tax=Neptunomonas marina TaxID=1815562 RepID=A0A437Q716_9GAMM|nr:type II secretion system protein GspD [Neptunomonas marina]